MYSINSGYLKTPFKITSLLLNQFILRPDQTDDTYFSWKTLRDSSLDILFLPLQFAKYTLNCFHSNNGKQLPSIYSVTGFLMITLCFCDDSFCSLNGLGKCLQHDIKGLPDCFSLPC